MTRSQYMREWRKKQIALRRCPDCGADTYGTYHCAECREKRAEYNRAYMQGYNAKYWAANKGWINERRRKA